jgi:hypothetical protein
MWQSCNRSSGWTSNDRGAIGEVQIAAFGWLDRVKAWLSGGYDAGLPSQYRILSPEDRETIVEYAEDMDDDERGKLVADIKGVIENYGFLTTKEIGDHIYKNDPSMSNVPSDNYGCNCRNDKGPGVEPEPPK